MTTLPTTERTAPEINNGTPGERFPLVIRFRRQLIRVIAPIVLGVFLILTGALPAAADFSVCNQTLDVVNVAIGYEKGATFETEGWWTIGSNQCATVIRQPIPKRYIYVYATDVFGQTLLDGTQKMCVGAEKFTIDDIESCWQRGYREAQFYEVDTKQQDDWRLFLSDPPSDTD